MGEVYRATDTALERPVAVKLLSERYTEEPEARARFQREAHAAARLSSNRNIVTVFDVGEHHGRPLIVMEYLDGGSVLDRLREGGRVPREQALDWLEQTADALDRAHASGIVHRDVKPANLLLDGEDNVHVSDFGIASASGLDTLTLPGTVLGTAGYLSPEQARGESATPASDRYSLGVVAFELLTGRRPFAADTPTTEAFAHLNADVPTATSFDPALPPRVDDVLRRALAKDPDSRPPTARELVAELRDSFEDERGQVPPALVGGSDAPTRRTVHRRSRRLSGAVVALVASGVLAAGFALAVLIGADDDPGQDPTRSLAQASSAPIRTATTAIDTTTAEPAVDGAALNDEGFALVQAGDFAGALPILREAVVALNGSNSITEAYASYNLAFARFAVGRCDGVVGLLDRSERIQGQRDAIDDLRNEWESRCASDRDGEGRGNGKAKGRREKDEEDD